MDIGTAAYAPDGSLGFPCRPTSAWFQSYDEGRTWPPPRLLLTDPIIEDPNFGSEFLGPKLYRWGDVVATPDGVTAVVFGDRHRLSSDDPKVPNNGEMINSRDNGKTWVKSAPGRGFECDPQVLLSQRLRSGGRIHLHGGPAGRLQEPIRSPWIRGDFSPIWHQETGVGGRRRTPAHRRTLLIRSDHVRSSWPSFLGVGPGEVAKGAMKPVRMPADGFLSTIYEEFGVSRTVPSTQCPPPPSAPVLFDTNRRFLTYRLARPSDIPLDAR